LPSNGCKYCGCKGCNPIDIRRDKRQEIKNKLKKEQSSNSSQLGNNAGSSSQAGSNKYLAKRQRLLESDDEELLMQNEYDEWNRARKHFNEFLMQHIS